MTKRRQSSVIGGSIWAKAIVLFALLVLSSTASLAATVEVVIVPGGGLQINAVGGDVTYTSPTGQTTNIPAGTTVSVSASGDVTKVSTKNTILQFHSAVAQQFLSNPTQFLTDNSSNGNYDLAAVISDAGSDPANLQTILNALAGATADQQAEIGKGLGELAAALQQSDPDYANQIQAAVAATGNTQLAAGYATGSGNTQITSNGPGTNPGNAGAAGGGGAGGGGGGGGSGGPTGGGSSFGSSGSGSFNPLTPTTTVNNGSTTFTFSGSTVTASTNSSVSPH